ncbi:MAG: class I SAM-dependent methyltransferase [Thermoproteota archaeon]
MDYDYQKEVGKLYDVISEEFDRTRDRPDSFLEMLVSRGFQNECKLIFDNGCGNCRNSRVFSQRNTIIAGDISRNMIKRCAKNVIGRDVHYVQYALTHLPFREKVFDGILCIATIHHLKRKDVEGAMMEMGKVLKDKSWMLVSSWSIKILKNKRFLDKSENVGENYFLISWGKHKRFYFLMDAKTLRVICMKSGFADAMAFEYGMNNYSLMDRRKIKSKIPKKI